MRTTHACPACSCAHAATPPTRSCLDYLREQRVVSDSQLALLERLVYEEDAQLLETWAACWSIDHDADPVYTKRCFDVFVSAALAAVDASFARELEQLARRGYALVNKWSSQPNPLPPLFADSARMEAVGLPAAVELRPDLVLLAMLHTRRAARASERHRAPAGPRAGTAQLQEDSA